MKTIYFTSMIILGLTLSTASLAETEIFQADFRGVESMASQKNRSTILDTSIASELPQDVFNRIAPLSSRKVQSDLNKSIQEEQFENHRSVTNNLGRQGLGYNR